MFVAFNYTHDLSSWNTVKAKKVSCKPYVGQHPYGWCQWEIFAKPFVAQMSHLSTTELWEWDTCKSVCQLSSAKTVLSPSRLTWWWQNNGVLYFPLWSFAINGMQKAWLSISVGSSQRRGYFLKQSYQLCICIHSLNISTMSCLSWKKMHVCISSPLVTCDWYQLLFSKTFISRVTLPTLQNAGTFRDPVLAFHTIFLKSAAAQSVGTCHIYPIMTPDRTFSSLSSIAAYHGFPECVFSKTLLDGTFSCVFHTNFSNSRVKYYNLFDFNMQHFKLGQF